MTNITLQTAASLLRLRKQSGFSTNCRAGGSISSRPHVQVSLGKTLNIKYSIPLPCELLWIKASSKWLKCKCKCCILVMVMTTWQGDAVSTEEMEKAHELLLKAKLVYARLTNDLNKWESLIFTLKTWEYYQLLTMSKNNVRSILCNAAF